LYLDNMKILCNLGVHSVPAPQSTPNPRKQ
jgi:hypothetical protein